MQIISTWNSWSYWQKKWSNNILLSWTHYFWHYFFLKYVNNFMVLLNFSPRKWYLDEIHSYQFPRTVQLFKTFARIFFLPFSRNWKQTEKWDWFVIFSKRSAQHTSSILGAFSASPIWPSQLWFSLHHTPEWHPTSPFRPPLHRPSIGFFSSWPTNYI